MAIKTESSKTESLEFGKVIFQKDDFAIFSIKSGQYEGMAAVGKVPMAPDSYLNVTLDVTGEWKQGKFGPQFAFTEVRVPQASQVVHFLTNVVRHVPKASAIEINKKYGSKIWKILDENPEELIDIKGIGKKKLDKIIKSWKSVRGIFNLSNLLSPAGVTTAKIYAIHKYFEEAAVSIIEQNPYHLTKVPGIGFKLADKIALALGMSIDDPRRIRAAVDYSLQERSDMNGDTAFVPSEIANYMRTNLGELGTYNDCMDAIRDMIEEEDLVFVHPREDVSLDDRLSNDDMFTTRQLYKYESDILKLANNRKYHGRVVEDLDAWIDAYVKKNKIKPLGEEQIEAIRLVNERPSIMGLVGYAGTGKTTTSRVMLDLLKEYYGNGLIICCALSGIAASRIKQKSGFPAGTIHSTFEYRGSEGWGYNKHNKMKCDVLVVDESSMVNSEIFSKLLEAVDTDKTMVILIGDTAQLNPIGSAQPFTDMVDNNLIEHKVLTKIYRQGEGSGLAVLASQVRQQVMPKEIFDEFEDFKFNKTYGNANVLSRIKDWSVEHGKTFLDRVKSGRYIESIGTFQVISPMRKEGVDLTVSTLNPIIQDLVNPKIESNLPAFKSMPVYAEQKYPNGSVVPGLEFRVGDKVVHTENAKMNAFDLSQAANVIGNEDNDVPMVEQKVMNGQIGIVVDATDKSIIVNYPIENYAVEYTKNDALSSLSLGYAITIHKSQGSEYENVIMPLVETHSRMLNAKLFYTAMTRASKNFEAVGAESALEKACTRAGGMRNTCLAEWATLSDLKREFKVAEAANDEVEKPKKFVLKF